MARTTRSRRRSWLALAASAAVVVGLIVAPTASAAPPPDPCATQVNDTPSKLIPCIQTADLWNHMQAFQAIAKAKEINTKMDIAVVDAGGNLKAFARMDGAWLGSIDIAQKKARTARQFDMDTGEIGKLSQPGKPLYQIEVSNGGLITFPGGLPPSS